MCCMSPKPVLPTFYDECKGGDFQLKLSLPLQQKVQWVQAFTVLMFGREKANHVDWRFMIY